MLCDLNSFKFVENRFMVPNVVQKHILDMFHVHLRRICFLLLLGGVLYKYQLGLFCW